MYIGIVKHTLHSLLQQAIIVMLMVNGIVLFEQILSREPNSHLGPRFIFDYPSMRHVLCEIRVIGDYFLHF